MAMEWLIPRVLGMLGLGSVSTPADDTGPSQTHQVAFPGLAASGPQSIDPISALYAYGFTSNPHPGADALVVFQNGDRTRPILIATGDRRYRLTGTATGEVAIYDDLGQQVHLTRGGIVINAGANPLTVNATAGTTINGPLAVTGDATIGGISFLKHVHGDVQTGTGVSGAPQS